MRGRDDEGGWCDADEFHSRAKGMTDIADKLREYAKSWSFRAGDVEPTLLAIAEIERLRECLQSIANMKDDEPRQPDDMDWRARALECKRVAAIALPRHDSNSASGGAK